MCLCIKTNKNEITRKTAIAIKKLRPTTRIKINKFGLSNETKIIEYKDYGMDSGKNTLLKDADFHDKQIVPLLRFADVVKGAEYCRNKKIDRIDLFYLILFLLHNTYHGKKEFLLYVWNKLPVELKLQTNHSDITTNNLRLFFDAFVYS